MTTPVTASAFWIAFQRAVQHAKPEGFGDDWTTGMYRALHYAQSRLGLWCQCKSHGDQSNGSSGERLGIDFLWFPQVDESLGEDEAQWTAPLVGVEHENGDTYLHRSVDHWKVSQLAVPLRVFVGYARSAQEMPRACETLRNREPRWRAVANGEALIILGHRDMAYACFRAWWAPQGSAPQDWKALSTQDPCSHQ